MTKLMERLAPNGNGREGREPTVGYELVDRERALDLLKLSVDNRKIQKAEVKRISADLTSGRFVDRVADVRITVDGRLIDGQHTLHAIVETGVSAVLTIHRNARDEEWIVIDSGTKRTIGQSLTRMGFPNANNLGTLAHYALVWRETGYPVLAGKSQTFDRTLTSSVLVEYAAENADAFMPHIKQAAKRYRNMPIMMRTWIAAVSVALQDADAELGPLFMAQLFDETEADNNPLLLRQRLTTYAMKSREHRPEQGVVVAMTIKAFNAWVTGKQLSRLSWSPTEEFPRIVVPKEVIG